MFLSATFKSVPIEALFKERANNPTSSYKGYMQQIEPF